MTTTFLEPWFIAVMLGLVAFGGLADASRAWRKNASILFWCNIASAALISIILGWFVVEQYA
ncbi:hypothetical protein Pam1_42 [Pseudanabaena phage Pam1]|nr:hypothetical protein Pam1_42 [Pseudanabaena phage Pam1]